MAYIQNNERQCKSSPVELLMCEFNSDSHLDEYRYNLQFNLEKMNIKRIPENIYSAATNLMGRIGKQLNRKSSEDSNSEVSGLQQLFTSIDSDHGGTIDKFELFDAFMDQGAGDRFTHKEINIIIDFLDKNGDGEIDFDEFLSTFQGMRIRTIDDLVEKSYLYVLLNKIDSDQSGEIDYEELKQFFVWNHLYFKDTDMTRLMKQIDADGSGELDFFEFNEIFSSVKSFDDLIVQMRLRVVFNQVDTDESGELEFQEIKQLFASEKIEISDAELQMLMDKIDQNGDGVIDYEEFSAAFRMITDVKDLVEHWQNMNCIDVGSDLSAGSGLASTGQLLIAGGCGGILSRTATAPLERLKILAQTGTSTGSTWQTFQQIVRNQGFWRGLWKGNGWAVLRTFPFAGSVTLVYTNFLKHIVPEKYQERINDPRDPVASAWRFAAGVTAGCVATTVTYPLDLMKANEAIDMSAITKTHFNKEKLITQFRSMSFKNAFRGLGATMFAVPVFIGFQNATYDFLRIYATSKEHMDMKPSVELFAACGCAAGVTAQSICYPMDVIRRRIQTDVMWKGDVLNVDPQQKIRLSRVYFSGLVNVIRAQGLRPLFAGLTPTYMKIMPSVAISVTARDVLLGRLNKD